MRYLVSGLIGAAIGLVGMALNVHLGFIIFTCILAGALVGFLADSL